MQHEEAIVGGEQIDDEVHEFVSKNTNGLSQHRHKKKHHKKPDLAERGMDEEVHNFVTDSLPPLNTRVKNENPWLANGSDKSAFKGAAL